MIAEQLQKIYELMLKRFGPQNWWPGETPFEVVVGAILTQNTNWTNVEKAIKNLKSANVLNCNDLYKLDMDKLAELIRPAGYFNIKAKRLKNFIAWLSEDYQGSLENLSVIPTSMLREELLAIKGIGPETADSILLYALQREVFVIDTYTARIAIRHHLVDTDTDYHQLQDMFQSNLEPDVQFFNEYHALLVKTAKEFCKTKPNCADCPLNVLPHTVEREYF